jgi:hypothetical protein
MPSLFQGLRLEEPFLLVVHRHRACRLRLGGFSQFFWPATLQQLSVCSPTDLGADGGSELGRGDRNAARRLDGGAG